MRIVVENGAYRMDNLGDVAMLQVCVRRIRSRWPQANVRVIVDTPDRLRDAVPGAEPLAPGHGHRIPMTTRIRGPRIEALERSIQRAAPGVARWARRRQIEMDEERLARFDAFHAALEDADAVVCSGGGFLNDCHPDHAEKVFYTLGTAGALRRPTAMFGAGLGPLADVRALALARPAMRSVEVVGLREGEGNLQELQAWGASPRRTFVTGDDAVELAREAGRPASGQPDAMGVSLRFAHEYGRQDAAWLPGVVADFRRARGVPLLGLPVRSRLSPENDVQALRSLLGDEAPDLETTAAVETPNELLDRIRRCRVVLSGTYHAGVFALSLGTPVVTLSGSAYYDRKFAGLAEQFGEAAVRRIRYEDPEAAARTRRALDELWEAAPGLREPLTLLAESQVERSRDAYAAFFRIVEERASFRSRRVSRRTGDVA